MYGGNGVNNFVKLSLNKLLSNHIRTPTIINGKINKIFGSTNKIFLRKLKIFNICDEKLFV